MSITEKHTNGSKIAYFSMEIGLRDEIPTFSGGLGILAGDTIKSSADLNLPLVAVTLIYHKGYFKQDIDDQGRQKESPAIWDPSESMRMAPEKVDVTIEGRKVYIQTWVYFVRSPRGGEIPVFFLDTNLPENSEEDRELTYHLYGRDDNYRIKQEVILGIGGVKMLKALGFKIKKYHMNEGHAAFLTLELLHQFKNDLNDVWDESFVWNFEAVKELCVFTTHTPVEAGHDKFNYDLYRSVIGDYFPEKVIRDLAGEEHLNMTLLALNLSNDVNGVAKKHGEVSQNMFPGYKINSITNGVHSYTWTCDSFKKLYDKYLPGWANEPELFVRVDMVPDRELWDAHLEAKRILIDYVNTAYNMNMGCETLTIGFARRFATYKRASLLFADIERLEKIATGRIQVIYAGKAHPKDEGGKKLIEEIISYSQQLKGKISIAFINNYNMETALKIVSGVDVWLNNPIRPLEASGTSGMKAAHNGVLNFSVLDGWWIEGHIEGDTGWSIGPESTEVVPDENADEIDTNDLYNKLEKIIIPTFYQDKDKWISMMKSAIGKNAYYFNTHRMMLRYVTEAYIR
jgi:starch phosphorylase